jgi:hypothetical protein
MLSPTPSPYRSAASHSAVHNARQVTISEDLVENTHDEAVNRLVRAGVLVNDADAAEPTRVVVKEPERCVHVRGHDRDRVCLCGAIDNHEGRLEAVLKWRVVMDKEARRGEVRLNRGVVPRGDCASVKSCADGKGIKTNS